MASWIVYTEDIYQRKPYPDASVPSGSKAGALWVAYRNSLNPVNFLGFGGFKFIYTVAV